MAAVYQGHNTDGSGVQKHSCGANYPYVVGRQFQADFTWFVRAPDGGISRFATGDGAFGFAVAAAKIYNS